MQFMRAAAEKPYMSWSILSLADVAAMASSQPAGVLAAPVVNTLYVTGTHACASVSAPVSSFFDVNASNSSEFELDSLSTLVSSLMLALGRRETKIAGFLLTRFTK